MCSPHVSARIAVALHLHAVSAAVGGIDVVIDERCCCCSSIRVVELWVDLLRTIGVTGLSLASIFACVLEVTATPGKGI
jgi:hypothetical protein